MKPSNLRLLGIKNRQSSDTGRKFGGDGRELGRESISTVPRTTIQIALGEMLTINVGRLKISRWRVSYPRPLWTQAFAI
jgi:hypothetical protein